MTARPTAYGGLRDACLGAVRAEPGSTASDVHTEIRESGSTASSRASVAHALTQLAKSGRIVCQHVRRGGRVHACYRPNPEEVPYGEEENPSRE